MGTVGIFILGAICATVISAVRWHHDYHMGVVAALVDGGFMLEQPDHTHIMVRVDPLTVREGRKVAEDSLTVGADVVVIGVVGDDGSITAQVVRVVDVHMQKPERH